MLRTGKPALLSQHFEKCVMGRKDDGVLLAVDLQHGGRHSVWEIISCHGHSTCHVLV